MKNIITSRLIATLAAVTLGASLAAPALADNHVSGNMEANMENSMEAGSKESKSIVGIATSNDSFETLTAALKAADLVNTLDGSTEYTVFAPTDAAFEELPDGALDYLLRPENKETLTQVLTYHVVPGETMSNELSSGGISALSGGIVVRVDSDRVIVNNGSVITPDIDASNGVVHVINRVLIPTQIRQQLMAQLSQGM